MNNSLRPVIIVSMNLTWNGEKVAPVRTFLPGSTTDAAALGDRPLFEGRSLPFALESRDAETLTGFADFSVAQQEATLEEKGEPLELAERFCEEVDPRKAAPAAATEGLRKSSSSLGLQVESDPGEPQEVEVMVSQPTEPPNIWTVDMAGERRHPTGVRFWLPTSSPSAFRFVTAKVWRRNGGLEHAGSLPVAGANPARFNFSALPDGSYRMALFRREQILAIAAFNVPLPGHSRQIFPSGAQKANGQCLEIGGRNDVFTHTPAPSEN